MNKSDWAIANAVTVRDLTTVEAIDKAIRAAQLQHETLMNTLSDLRRDALRQATRAASRAITDERAAC